MNILGLFGKKETIDKNDSDTHSVSQVSFVGSYDSTNSLDIGNPGAKKCYICSTKFNFRKKHFCKFCQNAVCSDHSAKTRSKEGKQEAQRICDLCDQEEEKSAIKRLIDHEVSSLSEELKMAKTTNERLYKDHLEKTANVNQLEEELETQTTQNSNEISSIHEEIDRKRKEKQEALDLLEKLKDEIRSSKMTQLAYQDKTRAKISDLQNLEEKLKSVNTKNEKGILEVDKLEDFISQNFNTEKIMKNLCARCSGKVTENLQRVHARPIWEEEKPINSK